MPSYSSTQPYFQFKAQMSNDHDGDIQGLMPHLSLYSIFVGYQEIVERTQPLLKTTIGHELKYQGRKIHMKIAVNNLYEISMMNIS